MRKLNSNKTQILHRIRLRNYTPNTTLQDTRPEGNLQADDEIIIPQDDLYIISWETNFDDFPPNTEQQTTPKDYPTHSDEQDAILTDLDLRSARRQTNTESDNPDQYARDLPNEDRQSDRRQQSTESENIDLTNQDSPMDTKSKISTSVGNDTSVPDVIMEETDDYVLKNESPRGGKYNLRPNPTPNFTDEYRY